jgi:N-acetylmuramoyl-L-alanine amidase
MRKLTEIIVHCSATRPEWMDNRPTEDKVEEIRRWHVEDRGWSDIGYHYIIDRDGTVKEGRSMERDGAHVRGHNKGTVGICLLGGFGSSENDSPHDHYTPSQLASLRMLIADMEAQHTTISKVSGHNEYAAKACPGFRVQTWLKDTEPKGDKPFDSKVIKAATAAATGVGGQVVAGFAGWGEISQIILAVGIVLLLAFIIWDRRKKQKRGVL